MTYRTAAIAAALAAAAASTVAPAADRNAPPAADATASAANGKSDATKRYCIRSSTPGAGPITGSILSLSGCRTRAQWEARGISLPKD